MAEAMAGTKASGLRSRSSQRISANISGVISFSENFRRWTKLSKTAICFWCFKCSLWCQKVFALTSYFTELRENDDETLPFIFQVKASLSFCPSISMSRRIGTRTSDWVAFSWMTAGSWSSKLGNTNTQGQNLLTAADMIHCTYSLTVNQYHYQLCVSLHSFFLWKKQWRWFISVPNLNVQLTVQ